MTKRLVQFFESPGRENTQEVVRMVVKRTEEGDIEAIVVASVSGKTSVKVAEEMKKRGLRMKVICVSGPPSWKKYAPEYEFPLIGRELRKKMDALGVQVINDVEEPFRQITFRDWWENKTIEVSRPESDLFWMSLICVGGHGLRTAVEAVFMAVEAAVVSLGERVISIAGTGTGADTAIVMATSSFGDAVGVDPKKRMKIEEILAMPKKTRWRGYG